MKKVLLLAPMSSVHERFNAANIAALRTIGCEIHLAANFQCNDHDRAYKTQAEREGIVVHDIAFQRHSLLKNQVSISKIRKLLECYRFDMVHCHTETAGMLVRFCTNACKATKYVYTPHGMSFYKGSSLKSQMIYRSVEKWICGRMSANLAINQEEFEVLKRWNESTAFYVRGIGLDLETIKSCTADRNAKRQELGVPKDATMIMSVGELNSNKNHKVVIEAVSEMRCKNIYYVICGDGEKCGELLSLANEKGISERLILTGYRYDVKDILKAADIFAFPSYHEGLPVSVMEAMAAGLPVVCSEIRGNLDLIQNGMGGFLCPPDDVLSWKNGIESILHDSNMHRKCSEMNRVNIELYSFPRILAEIVMIYRGILEK
jgi:glycosyltransferase involved in cell wall biosynthesis